MDVDVALLQQNYKSAEMLLERVERFLQSVEDARARYEALRTTARAEAEERKKTGAAGGGAIRLDQANATALLLLYAELVGTLGDGEGSITALIPKLNSLLMARTDLDEKEPRVNDDDKDYVDEDDDEYEMDDDDDEDDFVSRSGDRLGKRGRSRGASRSRSSSRPTKKRAYGASEAEARITDFFSKSPTSKATAPVPVGCQVAACTTRSGEWILASVTNYFPAKGLYEVQDADQGDDALGASSEEAGGKKFKLPRSNIIPLPPENLQLKRKRHQFVKGATVLAMFPATTCFYHATVSGGGPKSRKSSDYLVKFVDDEDETGQTPDRAVPPRFVLSLP